MTGPGLGRVLAGSMLCCLAFIVTANEDCLWYIDKNGAWQPSFDCEFFSFCCGDCHHRYCCRDPFMLFSERQQKHCISISRKMIAGIASAVSVFIIVITIIICCFVCSCCYLYRRREQMDSDFETQEMQVVAYPVQPTYPIQQLECTRLDPKPGQPPSQQEYACMPVYPPTGPTLQYPVYPPSYNPAAPPPYLQQQPTAPGFK
ncbi:protein shisa-4 [Ambystoma mexicanum]|uniref:protein shisa-4 n=1 Tax=Ambystoma mexicanum TaxID=8296 RepID=UPI0037E7982C